MRERADNWRASVGYRAPTIGGAMNETQVFDGLSQLDPSRFVKSDDNVGVQARCASAPTNGG
jgi:hypothetical protein